MPDTALEPRAILAALGITSPDAVTPVSGGRDTAIWRIEHQAETFALRVFRSEQARVVEHEVAAMRAAAAGGIPVPAVHAVAVWHERPVMLLAWHTGQTMVAALRQEPERAFDLGVLSGEVLARIHALPAPPNARSGLTGSGQIEPRLHERLTATSRAPHLLHMDFHPLNLLTDGQRITAVLDWTNTRSGDPRADLARSISILRLDAGALSPEEQRVVRHYERGLRHGYGAVPDLAPFLAWAGAFMLHDIQHRLDVDPHGDEQRSRITAWIARWQRRAVIASSPESSAAWSSQLSTTAAGLTPSEVPPTG